MNPFTGVPRGSPAYTRNHVPLSGRIPFHVGSGPGKLCLELLQDLGSIGQIALGSILLETSKSAPEIPGLDQLWDVSMDPDSLIGHWTSRLSDQLGLTLANSAASPPEIERAESLQTAKFRNSTWTLRR